MNHKITFQSIKQLITPQLFYLMVDAYLMYALIHVFTFNVEENYLKLNPTFSFVMACLMMSAMIFFLYCMRYRWPKTDYERLFIGLALGYFGSVIWTTPSLLIAVGYLLLVLILFAKLSFDEHPYRFGIPIFLLALFPRFIYLSYHGAITMGTKFEINPTDWDMRRVELAVICLVIASLIGAAILMWSGKPLRVQSNFFQKGLTFLRKHYRIIVLAVILLYVVYLCFVMVAKVWTLGASTFDMGIFTQMFENMRQGNGPVTTVERDKLLSHFAVHVSPIYYLMLPFYALFPHPETLEVLQVLIVFSAIIPLQAIVKRMELPPFMGPLMALLFTVTPAMTSAGSYDLHENCFLVPLLLGLIEANLSRNPKQIVLMSLLTLMVKEDAMIYVITVGLYFVLQHRMDLTHQERIKVGLIQICLPLVYFVGCLIWLTHFGQGAMVGRFGNFLLPNEEGLRFVVKNLMLNPTYALASFFTQSKLTYLVTVLSGMAFLPLMQNRWANYIFFIPMIVINLLSDYVYQADLNFQYSYGTNVLLLFMVLLSLEAIYQKLKQKTLLTLPSLTIKIMGVVMTFAITLSTGFLYTYLEPMTSNLTSYREDPTPYDSRRQTLAKLPLEKKILAFAYYTVDLRGANQLYDIFYHKDGKVDPEIDLVVVPRTVVGGSSRESTVLQGYLDAGYKESLLSTSEIAVFEK